MKKCKARKTIQKKSTYLKYGFVITEVVSLYCPRCSKIVSAGPNYQPKYCGECGQKLDFKGIVWIPDKELGFARRDVSEQIKN